MLGIILEFFCARGKRGQGHFFHFGLNPAVVGEALRQYNQSAEAGSYFANSVAQAHVGLQQAVGAAFTGAMQKRMIGYFCLGDQGSGTKTSYL